MKEETTSFDRALAVCGNIDILEPLEFEGQADDELFKKLYRKKLKAFLKRKKRNFKKFRTRSRFGKANLIYIFRIEYINRLDAVEFLPKEILEKITDKRLFALGYANREVIETAKAFCEELKRKIEKFSDEMSEKEEELENTFKF